ncbi:hypothetical protein [Methanobacterium petrolearium]|uniref:hypothetical protein n=1 Tax=Methanobacterium petrolearium TaxID=710190 RepID=UPI001AE880E8|nr:hypothetical protein [Methanobacterium petrolearium]MBP1946323.1 hypothetical protein [Methanobacterium petrolearium]BDZ71422.1 hypothetical protein GCM10025861_19390 [Methanobacterium petrolearium]
MSIYEDLLTDFFKELSGDSEIPNGILADLEEQLRNGQIKSSDIVDIIKRGV